MAWSASLPFFPIDNVIVSHVAYITTIGPWETRHLRDTDICSKPPVHLWKCLQNRQGQKKMKDMKRKEKSRPGCCFLAQSR